MIGGNGIYAGMGGYIQVALPGKTSLTYFSTLDVAEWKLIKKYNFKKCGHSGSYGAINVRRTSIDWEVELKVWWNASNPPENLLQSGNSVALNLNIGDYRAWLANGVAQKHWMSPSAMLTEISAVNNSEGEDIYWQTIKMTGNSHIFLLPDEQLGYDEYIIWLRNRGEVLP